MLGDDVVAVDTTEFGESDVEEDFNSGQNEVEGEDHYDQYQDGSVFSDDESEGEVDLNQKLHCLNTKRVFDDTTSSAPETEIFFNFKRNPVLGQDDDVQSMADMVEQMVAQRMEAEKGKLKEEFHMLEKMFNKY